VVFLLLISTLLTIDYPKVGILRDRVLMDINAVRSEVGLPPLVGDTLLDLMATGHATYMHLNGVVGHYQEEGREGFFGAGPGDRAEYVGYPYTNIMEAIYTSDAGDFHLNAVKGLVNTLYHRLVILFPDGRDVGIGFADNIVVVNVGTTQSGTGRWALYPYPGMRNVPCQFYSDMETPDPMPDINVCGFPITIQWGDKLAFVPEGVELYDFLGRKVDGRSFFEDGWMGFVPAEPLLPQKRYTVKAWGRIGTGDVWEKEWMFTTTSPPGMRIVHKSGDMSLSNGGRLVFIIETVGIEQLPAMNVNFSSYDGSALDWIAQRLRYDLAYCKQGFKVIFELPEGGPGERGVNVDFELKADGVSVQGTFSIPP